MRLTDNVVERNVSSVPESQDPKLKNLFADSTTNILPCSEPIFLHNLTKMCYEVSYSEGFKIKNKQSFITN